MERIEKFKELLGSANVLEGEAVRSRPSRWGSQDPCLAKCIVRPASTGDVSEILKLCHECRQPVVMQGGMTGLVQGGVAGADEIVLSLERMNRIEELSPQDRTVLVQAGVPIQSIQEKAEDEGFVFPLDFGARGSATIGGAISTNAGGHRVLRYGMTRQLVLGLEVVLADGTVVNSLNRMLKNNAGYDLKQLFIGSEGTLGVVTRAVLRIFPRPTSENLALVAVETFDNLSLLLNRLDRDLGGTLSAFEVMWQEFYDLVTEGRSESPPLSPGHPYYALIEALGSDNEADEQRFEEVLLASQQEGLIVDGTIATSALQRHSIWAIRDGAAELVRLGPIFVFDISLPIRYMESYVEGVIDSIQTSFPGGRTVTFGHLGDGNLHFMIGVGRDDEKTHSKVQDIVYAPLSAMGGSVSGEHGIGLEKRDYLKVSRTAAEIELMKTLKRSLDPVGILNRGKIFPLDWQA